MNKRLLLFLGGGVIIVGALFLLSILGQQSAENQLQVVTPNLQTSDVPAVSEREMTLYFASPDATQLVSTTTQIGCTDDQSCLRATVEALIRGPIEVGLPVLPAGTRLLNLRVEADLIIFDFDAQLVDGHPGGSQSELLTVYALANSTAVNFPHLRRMQILIDGAAVDTLKGHVDLRRPLLADFTYSKRTIDSVDGKD
jgi:spore germination protein GerM